MKLQQLKEVLEGISTQDKLTFLLPEGTTVPEHYHVTEVGTVLRRFVDCGGTYREEETINFQLWVADDLDHRLVPAKLLRIIEIAEKKVGLPDAEIQVEYQGDTIRKFGLETGEGALQLTGTKTACLAQESCGLPAVKPRVRLGNLTQKCC